MKILNLFNFKCNIPTLGQLGFNEMASPIGERLLFLHNQIMFVVVFFVLFVGLILYKVLDNKIKTKSFHHCPNLEFIWTIIPMIICGSIAAKSIKILYKNDYIHNPYITIKAIGNQWYWSYEQNDWSNWNISIDQYMKPDNDLAMGEFRNYSVSEQWFVPINKEIRLITYSRDVIHSFAIPSLGLKSDAIPGRLNQINMLIKIPGLYYGQCSEICGELHSFMPICFKAVSQLQWNEWAIEHAEFIE